MTKRRVLAGIALCITATACFATLDTVTKAVSLGVPMLMALWFRYAFQAVATTAAVMPVRGLSVWRTRRLGFHALRGALLMTTSTCAFASLKFMPVAEFTTLVMLTPLALTLLAATVLKERVSPLRWALVAGGFAGTLVIIRPGDDAFTWASLLPLVTVACNAAFQVLTSQLARTEDPVTMHIYTGWTGTLMATLPLPFVWQWLPDARLWLGLAVMGLMGTVGHFLLILAYQRAPASTLTPCQYAQIGFATLGGWIAFGQVPDRWSVIGMAMIAVCGGLAGWLTVREHNSAPATQPPA